MAIAVACTGMVSAVMAAILMIYSGVVLQELVVELIGAALAAVLGSILAVRAGREVSGGPARAEMVTMVLIGALAAFAVVSTISAVGSGLLILPLVIGVCAVSVLLTVGLVLPLQARGRGVLGSVLVGLLLTVMLYTITPTTLGDAILLPVFCVMYSVVAFFHVRPFWRALKDRAF